MKWVKRGCWIAAWGVWVWLGVGLYHHLPRDLGPAVRSLPVAGGRVWGFVGQTNVVAIVDLARGALGNTSIRLLDAESGAEPRRQIQSRFGLTSALITDDPFTRSLRYGAIVGLRPMDESSTADRMLGAHRLNLLSGEWLDLSKRLELGWSLHPREPWLAHLERENGDRPARIVVFDYIDGRELFAHDMPAGTEFKGRPGFVANLNAVVVSIEPRTKVGDDSPLGLAMWTFGTQPTYTEVTLPASLRERASISASGRVLFGGKLGYVDPQAPVWDDVFDVATNQLLTSIPPDQQGKKRSPERFQTMIDPSGSTVLRDGPPTLYEVGTGRVLWRANALEAFEALEDQDAFTMAENWGWLWQAWFPRLSLKTCAHRSIATGELIFRTPGDTTIRQQNINAAETLLMLNDGTVHRWPLQRNWPLLAFCQTTLALPLVSAWAILRWRRNRRLRLASAAS